MQVLLPLYGADNVRVSVNTVVDLDRSYTDSTDYALEPWAQGKDDGIIGTQVWDDSIVRDDGQTAGGVAGTQSNADLNTYVENQVQPDGTESAVTASGQYRPSGGYHQAAGRACGRIYLRCHGIRDHQPVCCR
ncbi:MAG: flagellar M-ring protein FliF C-terminal domain-containing protein [Dysosmobacter sp.]